MIRRLAAVIVFALAVALVVGSFVPYRDDGPVCYGSPISTAETTESFC